MCASARVLAPKEMVWPRGLGCGKRRGAAWSARNRDGSCVRERQDLRCLLPHLHVAGLVQSMARLALAEGEAWVGDLWAVGFTESAMRVC